MSNAKIKTTNIKGKQYAEVHERIKHFRGNPDYAHLGINTFIETWDTDNEQVLIKAVVYDMDKNLVLASGLAWESRGDTSSFVNKTSYVENAETSAIGRALACMGIGIEDAYASAFEVANAVAQQNANDGKKKDHLKVVDPPKESEPADSIDSIPTHDSSDEIVQNLATRMHASACISYEKLQQLVNSSDFQEIADQLDKKQAEEIMGYVGLLKSALM